MPDPDREMMEIALRQINRLESRVRDLEEALSATRAEVSAEARRTSELLMEISDSEKIKSDE